MAAKNRILLNKTRFLACQEGRLEDTENLTISMYSEAGMATALAKELGLAKQEVLVRVRSFILQYCAACLHDSREGLDFLPHLYDALRTASIFSAFFKRKGKNRLAPSNAVFDKLSPAELSAERQIILSELTTDGDELRALVFRYAVDYVAKCREKPTKDAVDDLILLGADCGLDITEVGVSEHEFRTWLHVVSLETAKKSIDYLYSKPLFELLKTRKQTSEAIENLNLIVVMDGTPGMEEMFVPDEWHERVPLPPAIIGLDQADIEHIRRIERQLHL